MNLMVVFFISLIIPLFMYFFSLVISYKDYFEGKLSSYECGFIVSKKVHFGFSLVFFSIILMFVVFELEIVIFVILIQGDFYGFFSFFLFFLYVLFSFYLEWYFGKLVWFC